MNDLKKTIRSILLFIILIAITFYIVLKNQNIDDIKHAFTMVDIKFLLVGVIAMFIYYICEAINLGRTLKVLGEKSSFFSNLKYILIGTFFSAITPAASGGQPAQIYFMHKKKISIANATLSLLILLCNYHLVTVSLAIISYIFNYKLLSHPMRILFIVGLIINASLLAILLICVFSKKLSRTLIGFTIKILKFFKVKNLKEKEQRLVKGLNKYHGSAKYIKSHKFLILKTFLLTLLQMCAYNSVSYWVYRSFGFSGHSIFRMISLQAILYATVCAMPLPGSVGISEGSFLGIYTKMYPETMLSTAMILHRFVNFYLFVIISSIVVIIASSRIKRNITEK